MDNIKPELVDELLKGYQKPEDIIGENGLLKRLTKALLERAMNAELTNHLGYEKHDPVGHNSGNSPARVRFAAPKAGAPLPAARRPGGEIHATGGSGGNRIGGEIRFMEPDGLTAKEKRGRLHKFLDTTGKKTGIVSPRFSISRRRCGGVGAQSDPTCDTERRLRRGDNPVYSRQRPSQ